MKLEEALAEMRIGEKIRRSSWKVDAQFETWQEICENMGGVRANDFIPYHAYIINGITVVFQISFACNNPLHIATDGTRHNVTVITNDDDEERIKEKINHSLSILKDCKDVKLLGDYEMETLYENGKIEEEIS